MSGKQFIKVTPKTRLVRAYYIVNPNKEGIYVGSTTEPLSERMSKHRNQAKRCPDRKLYKECGGIENCEIHLIEEEEIPLPNFQTDRNVFEQGWIEAINPCWNTHNAYEPDSKRIYNASERGREAQKRYERSEKGRKNKKEYLQTPFGREMRRLIQQRYRERKRLANAIN